MDLEPTDLDATLHNASSADASHDEVDDELLIEEISIDGMCGVY